MGKQNNAQRGQEIPILKTVVLAYINNLSSSPHVKFDYITNYQ